MSPNSLSGIPGGNRTHLVIDSNLLLLLILGSFDENLIGRFKRLAMFTPDDFSALQHLVSNFQTIVVTPHILTEVSNLANSLPEKSKRSWSDYFKTWIESGLREQQIAALQLVNNGSFFFGITDAAMADLSQEILIVTTDNRLAAYLQRQSRRVLNFNHIRKPWLFRE